MGPFTARQAVEVREGDTWSAATVVKREGRRYLVHYANSDASTDEWVGLDRIRATGATSATPASTDADKPVATAGPQHAPSAGSGDDADAAGLPTLVEPDRSAVDTEHAAEPPAAWSVPPDPGKAAAATS